MSERANRIFDSREIEETESPVKQLLENLFNIIINIAPERENEFLSLFTNLTLKVTDSTIAHASCLTGQSYIEVSRGMAEFCWASAYSYLVLYDYIAPLISEHPMALNLQEEAEMQDATTLMNWGIGCISGDLLKPWPKDLPIPMHIEEGVQLDEPFNSANVLCATALAFIVFHELGHITLNHTQIVGNLSIIQEKEADRYAFNWILVSAPDLPSPGKAVALKASSLDSFGVIVNRIRRVNDTWGQIHVDDREHCESILTGQNLVISPVEHQLSDLVGSVDQGSTDKILRFLSLRSQEIGQVIGVPLGNPAPFILYQLSSAVVERKDVKGGAHLVVRAAGNQLGVFDARTLHFQQHRWVPTPGGPIYGSTALKQHDIQDIPDNSILLGNVIGTSIPIFLDHTAACEGHVAILGMTKMGKSTLATRIARELGKTRRVTILDQTGEYVSKKGFPPCDGKINWSSPGVSIFEPKPGEVAADRALNFLKFLVEKAVEEYKAGTPYPRVVIIDEAHQFIPEPAGLGFRAPGRDSSFQIGLLLMQVRKYGISVYLISQRTAVVAKSALSQCENLIAFRSVDQTGLDYLEAVAGADIRSLLPQLKQGEALVFGPAMSADGAVAVQVKI